MAVSNALISSRTRQILYVCSGKSCMFYGLLVNPSDCAVTDAEHQQLTLLKYDWSNDVEFFNICERVQSLFRVCHFISSLHSLSLPSSMLNVPL